MNPLILRRLIGGGVSFNLALLFASGEQGFVYDLKTAQVFQDSAGTIPALSGDNLGYVEETSGHGYNALQPVSGSRPVFETDSLGRAYIKSTGAFSMSASNVDFSSTSIVTSTVAFSSNLSDTGQQCLFSSGSNPFSTGGFTFEVNQEVAGNVGATFGTGAGQYRFLHGPSLNNPEDYVVTMQINPIGATDADKLKIWVNGTLVDTSTYLTSGVMSDAMFDIRTLYLMAGASLGRHFIGKLFFAASVGRELTTQERLGLEGLAMSRATGIPTYQIRKYGLSGNSKLTPTYAAGSTYSTSTWDTDATSVDVDYVSTILPTYGGFADIACYIDGSFYSRTMCSAQSGTVTVALPVGSKRVQLLNGAQTYTSGIIGTWVTDARFNSQATAVAPVKGGIVIYGDSIAIGQDASPASRYGWALLVRAADDSHQVSIEAFGTRSLHFDARNSFLVDKFAQRIAEYSPDVIWLAIGTNDYGLNRWSAASFGAAYSAMLDALHAKLPLAEIYAQTPLLRSSEAANGSGSSLGDYRAQIASAVSTRVSYATLVDGTEIMTTASLVDGVHPTTAGHSLYADYVKTILGII